MHRESAASIELVIESSSSDQDVDSDAKSCDDARIRQKIENQKNRTEKNRNKPPPPQQQQQQRHSKIATISKTTQASKRGKKIMKKNKSTYLPVVDRQWACCGKIVATTLAAIFAISLIVYTLIFPAIFRYSDSFKRLLLFGFHFAAVERLPPPETFGLRCTTQLFVNFTDDHDDDNYNKARHLRKEATKIRLGVWHTRPPHLCDAHSVYNYHRDDDDPRQHPHPHHRNRFRRQNMPTRSDFGGARWIVLYAHGIGRNRAPTDRANHCAIISTIFRAHVVSFDYRGFGDSTAALPSADRTAADTRAVYEWILRNRVEPKRVLLWGHSMGSAIVTRMLSALPNALVPYGATLEAPFTTLAEEFAAFPLVARYLAWLPWFDYFFVEPIRANSAINFDNIALMHRIRCPLLIAHAEDDEIIPIEFARRLYERAKLSQPISVAGRTRFRAIAGAGFGHNRLITAPQMLNAIIDFLT